MKKEEAQTQQLQPQQIQVAAQDGAKLLVTSGAVMVPNTMVLNGSFSILNSILTGIANGSNALISVEEYQEYLAWKEKQAIKK